MTDAPEKEQQTESQGVYSALTKRPAPKVVDPSDETVSYVAGVRIVDEIQQRKNRFNGWKDDDNALLVVSSLRQGETDKFVGADLSAVDFSGADLSTINLQNADLKNADLSGVDLRGADLRGADLRGANLEEADLEGADLEGALLDGAYLKNAKIAGAKLAKQALNELEKMQQMQLDAEEGRLDLRKVNLKYLDLRRLDLRGVDLTGVDLSGVNLVGVNLSGVKIDPMYLDGSYAFKQAAGRKIEIKEGNIAGLDLTTANRMKAKETEVEILRKKRMAGLHEEQARLEEMSLAAERLKQAEEAGSSVEASADAGKSDGLSAELSFLRSRRLNQASPEELKARLKDVVLENHSGLKSGARSLVTHRPRRKEELPPSKYDFPILYPQDEDEKAQNQEKEKIPIVQKAAKTAGEMTEHVKNVLRRVMPRSRTKVRLKRQRQKQRS